MLSKSISEIEATVIREWAAKAVESLDEDAKRQLITAAIYRCLESHRFDYEVSKVVEAEGVRYALELVKDEAIQQAIYEATRKAVDKIISEFVSSIHTELSYLMQRVAENLNRKLRS